MKKIIQISLVLGCLLLFSCKKDKIVPPLVSSNPIQDNCPEMYEIRTEPYNILVVKADFPNCAVSQHVYPDDTEYAYIHVKLNPNNPYEFAFLRRNFTTGNTDPNNYELGVYNFCRNDVNILTTDLFLCPIEWNSTGWIIFSDNTGYKKIKSSGENLTSVVTPPLISSNDFIKSSPDGSRFLACDKSLLKVYVFNEDGNNQQIMPFNSELVDWFSNNELVFYESNSGFSIYNLNTGISSPWSNYNHVNIAENFFVKNSKLFLTNDLGFYEIDNNTVSLIDSNYETYQIKSIQPINENLYLVQRTIYDTTHPCVLNTYSYASIYNRNTQTEKMIQIP